MIVMPSNSSGWFWHSLALMTGRLGHLYSSDAQRGPWPWFPYAFDCNTYPLTDWETLTFNEDRWQKVGDPAWRRLLFWGQVVPQKPMWAIVPDQPGNSEGTFRKWSEYAGIVVQSGFPLALAVQDGMTPEDVRKIRPFPDVIAVGGSTDWKWQTIEMWASTFKRVHLLRCNSPSKLEYLHKLGVESCDGTGWNRGNRVQTKGLEEWLKQHARPILRNHELWHYVSRAQDKKQTTFA